MLDVKAWKGYVLLLLYENLGKILILQKIVPCDWVFLLLMHVADLNAGKVRK